MRQAEKLSARGIYWLTLTALALGSRGSAETLRVCSWRLQVPRGEAAQPAAPTTEESRIREAALALKKLNPDIILLQQARDWQMCGDLVQALKPADYNIAVCSAFRDPHSGAASPDQVAILSKRRAYFCWSEGWRAQADRTIAGGFAFAAFQIGNHRAGFFAVQLGDELLAPSGNGQTSATARIQSGCRQQWLAEVETFHNWSTNRVEALVIAGAFNSRLRGPFPAGAARARVLKEEYFGNDFLGAPLEQPVTLGNRAQSGAAADYVFAGLAPNPEVLPGVVLSRCPATCDLDLNPVQPPAPARVAAPLAGNEAKVPRTANGDAISSAGVRMIWLAGGLGGVMALASTMWILAKRRSSTGRRARGLLTSNAESGTGLPSQGTVVITARSVTESGRKDATASSSPRPAVRLEAPGGTRTHSGLWQRRALVAEQRADEANALVRAGLIPLLSQWLREKLVKRLLADRTTLLGTQQAAALKAMAVDQRLARIELQIQRQILAYERRIEELTRELASAKDGNRELIRAQIAQVKAEMEAARARTSSKAGF